MDAKFDLIGMRIKLFREDNGLSQEELGDRIGISNRHLSKVETGAKKPSLELVLKIANALKITVDDLLTDYLTNSNEEQNTELLTFFSDCTPAEKAILMDMLRHMKKLLQEHGI